MKLTNAWNKTELVNAWNNLEDTVTLRLHKIGVFRMDAALRRNSTANRIAELFDKTGISNKNGFDRYNQRHPDNPLPSPYADTNEHDGLS